MKQKLRSPEEIVQKGNELIVVAAVGEKLYFRIFESDGAKSVDTDQSKFPEIKQKQIGELRALLKGFLEPQIELPDYRKKEIKDKIIEILSGSWRWEEIGGRGIRIMKQQSTAWDQCRWLYQCGVNLNRGNEEFQKLPEKFRTKVAAG
jgi:hypothetical protein